MYGCFLNRATPKSSMLIGFSIVNHPFWGTPIYGNPQMLYPHGLDIGTEPHHSFTCPVRLTVVSLTVVFRHQCGAPFFHILRLRWPRRLSLGRNVTASCVCVCVDFTKKDMEVPRYRSKAIPLITGGFEKRLEPKLQIPQMWLEPCHGELAHD